MPPKIDWIEAMQRMLKKYGDKKHPLEYKNVYQLLVMVVLSAQDSDRHINQIAPTLFESIPNMKALSNTTLDALSVMIAGVRNSANKAKWLVELSQKIKADSNIPLNIEELTALPGIGRKSANVIMREAGVPAEGVIVDLHVVRVAPRLGIATGTDPKKIEKQIMDTIPREQWDAGMAMSFHGREICRPDPKCQVCFMNDVCAYYNGWK